MSERPTRSEVVSDVSGFLSPPHTLFPHPLSHKRAHARTEGDGESLTSLTSLTEGARQGLQARGGRAVC